MKNGTPPPAYGHHKGHMPARIMSQPYVNQGPHSDRKSQGISRYGTPSAFAKRSSAKTLTTAIVRMPIAGTCLIRADYHPKETTTSTNSAPKKLERIGSCRARCAAPQAESPCLGTASRRTMSIRGRCSLHCSVRARRQALAIVEDGIRQRFEVP